MAYNVVWDICVWIWQGIYCLILAEPDDDEEEEEEEVTTHNVSMKVMLDAYLQKLPQCVNRDFIDRVRYYERFSQLG